MFEYLMFLASCAAPCALLYASLGTSGRLA